MVPTVNAYRGMSDYLLSALARDYANAQMERPRDLDLKWQLHRIAKEQNRRRKVLDFYAAKYTNR